MDTPPHDFGKKICLLNCFCTGILLLFWILALETQHSMYFVFSRKWTYYHLTLEINLWPLSIISLQVFCYFLQIRFTTASIFKDQGRLCSECPAMFNSGTLCKKFFEIKAYHPIGSSNMPPSPLGPASMGGMPWCPK